MTRVLVVDDDPDIRRALGHTLRDEGYQVEEASNGQVALAMIHQEHPHVILLDMKMPGMDGWEFVQRYHDRYDHHAPIMVLTAAHDAAQRGAEVDVESTLSKPFDLDVLVARVAALANLRAAQEPS